MHASNNRVYSARGPLRVPAVAHKLSCTTKGALRHHSRAKPLPHTPVQLLEPLRSGQLARARGESAADLVDTEAQSRVLLLTSPRVGEAGALAGPCTRSRRRPRLHVRARAAGIASGSGRDSAPSVITMRPLRSHRGRLGITSSRYDNIARRVERGHLMVVGSMRDLSEATSGMYRGNTS